jgi:hypothetical protein
MILLRLRRQWLLDLSYLLLYRLREKLKFLIKILR